MAEILLEEIGRRPGIAATGDLPPHSSTSVTQVRACCFIHHAPAHPSHCRWNLTMAHVLILPVFEGNRKSRMVHAPLAIRELEHSDPLIFIHLCGIN